MKRISIYVLVFLVILISGIHCSKNRDSASSNHFDEIALKEALNPIHPGIPGKIPFWNKHSKRFIHAPAFEFLEIPGFDKYRFTATTDMDSLTYSFEAEKPWAPLTPIWSELPDAIVELRVEAVDNKNSSLQFVGEREFLKSTHFKGIQNQSACDYRESGFRNLDHLFHQPKIQYWLEHGRPDPGYPLWSHPSKIFSAVIVGMVHYAKYSPESGNARQAIKIAEITAEFLLNMSEKPGSPLEYWPETYWDGIPRGEHPYYENQIMANSPTISAMAYLDLFDYTNDSTYFTAAKRIAETYAKIQRKDGTWPQLMSTDSGDAIKKNLLIPTMVIELFDRFEEQYNISDFSASRKKAFDWCMRHPVQSFNWQAQFEDTRPQSMYENLSREEATELARILFKESLDNPEYVELAKELLRYSEDQFVIWDMDDPVLRYSWFSQNSKWNGTTREGGCDWFLPCVLEQYKFYTPIARSSQLQIVAYLTAFEATGETIYHAKAVALANALTIAQQYHGGGEFPTHMRKNLPEENWINNGVYPAITLIEKADDLRRDLGYEKK